MGGWKPRYCRLLEDGVLECFKIDNKGKSFVAATAIELASVREVKSLGGGTPSRRSFTKAPATALQLVGGQARLGTLVPSQRSGATDYPLPVAGPRTITRELDVHDKESRDKWLGALSQFLRTSCEPALPKGDPPSPSNRPRAPSPKNHPAPVGFSAEL